MDIEFQTASQNAKTLKECSNENLLKLYALYKQGTVGNNDKPCPSFYQITEKAKWNAWMELKDMDKVEAQKKYIELVKELLRVQNPTTELV